jgi:hypothetical protein
MLDGALLAWSSTSTYFVLCSKEFKRENHRRKRHRTDVLSKLFFERWTTETLHRCTLPFCRFWRRNDPTMGTTTVLRWLPFHSQTRTISEDPRFATSSSACYRRSSQRLFQRIRFKSNNRHPRINTNWLHNLGSRKPLFIQSPSRRSHQFERSSPKTITIDHLR